VNKDQFKGRWRQFKGEVKKKWAELTDDDLFEVEGNYDKFLGVVQKRYGDRKVEIERWAENWCDDQAAQPGKSTKPRYQI